jgi:hypothetical protein
LLIVSHRLQIVPHRLPIVPHRLPIVHTLAVDLEAE